MRGILQRKRDSAACERASERGPVLRSTLCALDFSMSGVVPGGLKKLNTTRRRLGHGHGHGAFCMTNERSQQRRMDRLDVGCQNGHEQFALVSCSRRELIGTEYKGLHKASRRGGELAASRGLSGWNALSSEFCATTPPGGLDGGYPCY